MNDPMDDEPNAAPDEVPPWLLGHWRLLSGAAQLGFVPGTQMEFRLHGQLRYAIPFEGGEQIVPLVYRVEGDVLRTDNPAASRATATRFHEGPGGVLVFDFAGSPAVFVRVSQ